MSIRESDVKSSDKQTDIRHQTSDFSQFHAALTLMTEKIPSVKPCLISDCLTSLSEVLQSDRLTSPISNLNKEGINSWI